MNTELTRLDTIVIEINTIKRQVTQATVAGAIAVGQRLMEAKASVPHGEWSEWLRLNVDFSVRTAQNLMAAAQEYGGRDITAMEQIGLTKAVQLLALPGDERAAFMEENPVEDMSTRQLKEAIEALQAEKAKMQLTIEELLAAPDTAREEMEAVRKENEALAQAKQAAVDANSNLKAQNAKLEEAEKQHAAAERQWKEARKEMQAALDAAEKERDRYKDELAEAGQPVIQQVTPPEVQRELEALRAEKAKAAASSGNETAIAEFKAHFAVFKDCLSKLETVMAGMSGEVKERYKAAMALALEIAGRNL